jgi:hypothetical protein
MVDHGDALGNMVDVVVGVGVVVAVAVVVVVVEEVMGGIVSRGPLAVWAVRTMMAGSFGSGYAISAGPSRYKAICLSWSVGMTQSVWRFIR